MTNRDPIEPVSLTIRNTIPELARMSLWLTGSLGRHGLSREHQFKFDLCANEAITNIISYGYPNGGDHLITLKLCCDDKTAKLTIQDDGVAFNPLIVPEHKQPRSLEDAKIGGLGIDLIRHYMDDVDYSREQDTNILQLKMQLQHGG